MPSSSSKRSKIALPEENNLDWRAIFVAIQEKAWLLILLGLVGTGLGFAYIKVTPQQYQSEATLEVDKAQKVFNQIEEVTTNEGAQDKETMNTVAAAIKSRTFLTHLVEKEGLLNREDFVSVWTKAEDPVAPTVEDAVLRILYSIDTYLKTGTRLIVVSARDRDPVIARDLAQMVAAGIINYGLDQRKGAANEASDVLVQEAERRKKALEESETKLQRYRDEHKAVSLEQDQNIIVAKMNDLNTKLSSTTAERVQFETDVRILKTTQTEGKPASEMLKLKSVAENPTVREIGEALAQKRSDMAVLSNRYKSKHPLYIALATEIASLERHLEATIPEVARQLESALEAAKENEMKFKEALGEQEERALELDRLAIQYNVLRREVESNKAIYEAVLSRRNEVNITKDIAQNNLKLLENATLPKFPVWPKKIPVLAASTGGCMMIGLGLIYLLSMADRSIKTVDQAEQLLGVPVMAAISQKKGAGVIGAFDVWKEPHSAIAEAFRSLRVRATLLDNEKEQRVFGITSAIPAEGKTFCASNFAISLAQQGLKTLLIDADLRKPRVSTAFYNEYRKPGLTECLAGKAELDEAVHSSELEQLKVLTAGDFAPNPAELLSSGKLKDIINEALKQYDRIVIDTAPVVAVSDTLIISNLVQTMMLVVRWNKTPASVVQRAIGLLDSSGKSVDGVIFNYVPLNSKSGYYHYGYTYYGSKGVYGAPA